jgi:CPA2 family monovalent cation:H+ antiporter-2
MPVEAMLLVDLTLIILAGTVVGCIARMLKQPTLFSYIIAGLIIGPLGLRLVANSADIMLFSELGVAFLLFAVGIETDFAKLVRMKGTVIGGAVLQVAATTAIVFSVMRFLSLPFIESAYIGMILAFSSTVIVVKILSSKNQVSTLHGRLIIGFAVVQDALAVLLMPLLANPATILQANVAASFAASIFSLFALAFVLNKFVLPKILAYFANTAELFYLIIVSVCFAFISISGFFGFSIAVGAFIGGISLSSLPYNIEAASKIRGLRDFFATIFFVSLGMQISLGFAGSSLAVLIVMLAVVYLLNPLIYFLIGLGFGYGARTSFLIGLALGQASEFSFILASQGFRLQQISQPIYSAALLVITVSMMTTPYMIENSNRLFDLLSGIFKRLFPSARRAYLSSRLHKLEKLPEKNELQRHTILVGCGVFGSGLVNLLRNRETFVVVDHNPHVVMDLIEKGNNAIYGNPESEEVWEKVSLEQARLLIATIPEPKESAKLIKKAKKLNPKITAFARAHYYSDALRLYEAGADFVCMPHVIGSNLFLQNVAEFLETGKMHKTIHLEEEYLQFLREKAKEEKQCFGL